MNEIAELTLSVENIADVLAPVGADELDYTVSVTGELFGSFSDMSLALDGPNLHFIGLDTSTPGLKSGTVLVESMSPATELPFYSFDVSYSVHIPEPSSWMILVTGLLATCAARRRRVIGK